MSATPDLPRLWRQEDVGFQTRDGTRLSGWLYRPSQASPVGVPAILISHGFTAVIHQDLAPFAEAFAEAGFVVLVYDHRGYGLSEGLPRQETDPFKQMHDMRDAITFLSMLAEVDEQRIGVWGASYSGAHALVVAAVDRRVACVVSVVPLTSGSECVKRLTGEANLTQRHRRMAEARRAEMEDARIVYQLHAGLGESLDWFRSSDPHERWINEVSVLSHDMVAEYEPADYIHRIAPTPLLMILADRDLRCCTDLQLAAYARAREPKRLVMFKGGHYEGYERYRPLVASESRAWFEHHLGHNTAPISAVTP